MKTRILAAMLAMTAAVAVGPQARAQDFSPAVVFDQGGKFDKSFNEAAYNGAERFKKETGTAYREFEVTNEGQREQALRTLVRRGASVIVAVGFSQTAAVDKVAKESPNTKFCLIDDKLEAPNVQSVTFKEEEGSFLVGMAAALASKTGKVGFIGGMDIPLIRNFLTGYEQGVKHVTPGAEVFVNMTGTTPAAWNDPGRGAELAKSQFGRGADVVFAAAGATGLGVMQAASDAGKLAIGVDSNQNHVHPGKVLTSMVKRVDVVVYDCMKAAKEGSWKAGHRVVGLKEDGVGYALDEHNRKLITPEMEAKLEEAEKQIIAGSLAVKPYKP
ncbi:BMP family ABC transporter substrate-binding protein (plasmid) [Azospirillum humicireducens]|uniref:BMP family ABC transporter substrate-binding protein n=1 Tax=Azospirillum humicireducens TaxID=1226968 RepID=A0A2R4VV92_9PROT|nr:BMP family ABC transporter substrate-binding protein [Azospirillum humicireducens]AWB08376.1 BMP family ABC transporter substrate-binding protein [Azospirillum humicireducens]